MANRHRAANKFI